MRRNTVSVAANPVLIGAVTTLVIIIGVFLAYTANSGLPFVPTTEVRVEVQNASRLVEGNDVREGGRRIGQVTKIDPVRMTGGRLGAELILKLDGTATPIPADSSAVIRARSALGLKYVDIVRGRSRTPLQDGGTLNAGTEAVPVEFDNFFDIFEPKTRDNVQRNLVTFGDGTSGRGADLNATLFGLPDFLGDLGAVMENLGDPRTGLSRMITELGQTMALLAPVAGPLADGFTDGADVFEAFSRNPEALQDVIEETPRTNAVALDALPRIRPALRAFADVSDDVRFAAREVRAGAGTIDASIRVGTDALPSVPGLAKDLDGTLDALGDLTRPASTDQALDALAGTFDTLNPTLKWAGPHVTVCNYFNYFFTFLADDLSEEDGTTGTLQRVLAKTAPGSLAQFGATEPTQVEDTDTGPGPAERLVLGDGADLHAQPYGRAVDDQGNADCESGQRGYPTRLLPAGSPADLFGAVTPRTPGNQGPTFKGQARVPAGQTFTAEPTGTAPQVVK